MKPTVRQRSGAQYRIRAWSASCVLLACLSSCERAPLGNTTPTAMEPVAEYRKLLNHLAKGGATLETLEVFEKEEFRSNDLLLKEPAVRRWVLENYNTLPVEARRFVLHGIYCVGQTDATPEFYALLSVALGDERLDSLALRCLEYYDIENRRTWLANFVRSTKSGDRYTTASALRIYLKCYGAKGIEPDIRRLFSKTRGRSFRLDVATDVVIFTENPLRQEGFSVINEILKGSYAERKPNEVAAIFSALEKSGVRGDDEFTRYARRISVNGRDEAKLAALSYLNALETD